MNIKRIRTPRGICSILDYRSGGIRYRPVLGYDLTTEREQADAIKAMVAIQVNVGIHTYSPALSDIWGFRSALYGLS